MATYDFPNIRPSNQTFEFVTNTKRFVSPLSNAVQTVTRQGSHWKTTMVFNNVTDSERAELQAFLTKLDGQTHRVRLRDYGAIRRGAATSGDTLLVRGAGQSGSSIDLDGATFLVTGYLKAGDYISFNGELHMVTADADSDAGGELTVSIAPPIRKVPADNVAVTHIEATGVFMVTNNPQWRTQPPYFSTITVEAIEDVLA